MTACPWCASTDVTLVDGRIDRCANPDCPRLAEVDRLRASGVYTFDPSQVTAPREAG